MKCPRCQHENPESAMFCNKCGYTLRKVTNPLQKTINIEGEVKEVIV